MATTDRTATSVGGITATVYKTYGVLSRQSDPYHHHNPDNKPTAWHITVNLIVNTIPSPLHGWSGVNVKCVETGASVTKPCGADAIFYLPNPSASTYHFTVPDFSPLDCDTHTRRNFIAHQAVIAHRSGPGFLGINLIPIFPP